MKGLAMLMLSGLFALFLLSRGALALRRLLRALPHGNDDFHLE